MSLGEAIGGMPEWVNPAQPDPEPASPFGAFIVLPFDRCRGHPTKNTEILDQLCARPQWTQAPLSPEALRENYAAVLTHPEHGIFEVWHGGTLVGILMLHGVVPGIEATFHFVFFDGNLMGKRRLLRQFIASLFQPPYSFRRLVMMVPEPVETLIRFARKALGFRYEGEGPVATHPALPRLGMDNAPKWVAEQGSRKESACWHKDHWVDVIMLRLLASEVTPTT